MNWKEYFKKNESEPGKSHSDFRITIDEGGVGVIHPLNRRGDTLPIKVTDQGIVITKKLEPVPQKPIEEKKDEKNIGKN